METCIHTLRPLITNLTLHHILCHVCWLLSVEDMVMRIENKWIRIERKLMITDNKSLRTEN